MLSPTRGAAIEEPAAQLTLLAPCQRRHLVRVGGTVLNQRERLQHGVVQVRGHLRALLLADARGALGGQAAAKPHEPGPEDDQEREDRQRQTANRVPVGPQDPDRVQRHERHARPSAATSQADGCLPSAARTNPRRARATGLRSRGCSPEVRPPRRVVPAVIAPNDATAALGSRQGSPLGAERPARRADARGLLAAPIAAGIPLPSLLPSAARSRALPASPSPRGRAAWSRRRARAPRRCRATAAA